MSLPAIAAGANTIWEHFETPEGQLAAVIVQTGIEERETDLSREVSGATAIVCHGQPERGLVGSVYRSFFVVSLGRSSEQL